MKIASVRHAAVHETSGDSDRASVVRNIDEGIPAEHVPARAGARAIGAAGELISQFCVEEFAHRRLKQELAKIICGVGESLPHQVAADSSVALQQIGESFLRMGAM